MSIISKDGDLCAIAALSCIAFVCSTYYLFTKHTFPPNDERFPEEQVVNAGAQRTVWSLLNVNATVSLPLPRMGTYQCRDQICSEFLSAKDRENIFFCRNSKRSPNIVPKCHFMNGTRRASIALVSSPGSGNTWVRGLLEKATGVCTGSEYCDNAIRNSGAIGEHVQSGNVLVVKTHSVFLHFSKYTVGQHSRIYGAAIVLIRNPLQAMVSEWNRRFLGGSLMQHTGRNLHVGSLSEKYFGNHKEWQTFVTKAMTWWKMLVLNMLLRNNGYPVLVVCYENILKNYTTEVKRMLDFLHMEYSDSILQKRLDEDFTMFHRNHMSTFEHYTESQKWLVRAGINDVLHQLNGRGKTIPELQKYLDSITLNIR